LNHSPDPRARTPATHSDHDSSARMLSYPRMLLPSTAQLPPTPQLALLI
jgi:hypothetical protein